MEDILLSLKKEINKLERQKKFKDMTELKSASMELEAQIVSAREVQLLTAIEAEEYMARIKNKYLDIMKKCFIKEYREQVINFNDDILTDRERLYLIRQQERKEVVEGMEKWKGEINKKSSAAGGVSINREEQVMEKEPALENRSLDD